MTAQKQKKYFFNLSKAEVVLWSVSVFTILLSFSFAYYGEMITYLGMTMPMSIFALISWLKNPYNGNKSIVLIILWILASIYNAKYISVVVCFVAFLVNDIYGFVNWCKMKKRQNNN